MPSPEEILKQYWGYDSFRPLQSDIIASVLSGKDTLALLPTGGGKSVCYQVPAMINEGLCLVVSPLIALMQDQVSRLKEIGVPAACIHSGLHFSEVNRILENTIQQAYKLLYISPERLQTKLFNEYLGSFDVNLIAVDEAHCISQWGHDFRPSYLKIADIRDVFPEVPILALTASATPDVQKDITEQLDMRDAAVFRQSFSRTNIFYSVAYSENKLNDTINHINKGCSIVYSRSRKQTENIGRQLEQNGISTAVYHAGMSKDERENSQEEWMTGRKEVMVATTAFGMGIDKPDVRTVLHYDAPEHLEAYYQEAGRAGRDGQASSAHTIYNRSDLIRLEESTALQYPSEQYLRQVYQAVCEYLQIPIGAEPDRYYPFDLFDYCRKFSLQPNQAIHALKLLEREELWTLSEAVYTPATIQFLVDRHTLDELGEAHPALSYVTIGLLRMYNTIFHYPTSVRESAIARQLRMKLPELNQALEQLARMEIIYYNKPGEGPQMFFHHYRVDSRYLIIDTNRIALLRKRHEKRTGAMIHYLQNESECREMILLNYFGEKTKEKCGHCDVCQEHSRSAGTDTATVRKQILAILSTAGNISIPEISVAIPSARKETILSVVREMIDNRVIVLRDGLLTLY